MSIRWGVGPGCYGDYGGFQYLLLSIKHDDIRIHIAVAHNCMSFFLISQYLALFHPQCYDYIKSSFFLSLSLEQKHSLPLNIYRGTLMHFTSDVCDTNYEFPGGTTFQTKRSTDILTIHHSHTLYNSFQVVWMSLVHSRALRSSVPPLPRD